MTPDDAPRIGLVPLDCAAILNGVEPEVVLENGMQVRIGPAWNYARPVADQTAVMLRRRPRNSPWIGYWVAAARSGQVVGTCGFRDAPEGGAVEIAYYTFPPYEGRGYATAAASALAMMAASSPDVRRVIAHTLRESNPSTRVLTKCGFSFVGEVSDLEDGPVWQWERRRVMDGHTRDDGAISAAGP